LPLFRKQRKRLRRIAGKPNIPASVDSYSTRSQTREQNSPRSKKSASRSPCVARPLAAPLRKLAYRAVSERPPNDTGRRNPVSGRAAYRMVQRPASQLAGWKPAPGPDCLAYSSPELLHHRNHKRPGVFPVRSAPREQVFAPQGRRNGRILHRGRG